MFSPRVEGTIPFWYLEIGQKEDRIIIPNSTAMINWNTLCYLRIINFHWHMKYIIEVVEFWCCHVFLWPSDVPWFIFLDIVGVKMESWGWELEELYDKEKVFLIQLLQNRVHIQIFFLQWLMQYPPKACFMSSTVQGKCLFPLTSRNRLVFGQKRKEISW